MPDLYTVGKTDELLDGKANTVHTHTTAQIGTGTPTAGSYVDGGTGAWTPLPAGSGVTMTENSAAGTVTLTNPA